MDGLGVPFGVGSDDPLVAVLGLDDDLGMVDFALSAAEVALGASSSNLRLLFLSLIGSGFAASFEEALARLAFAPAVFPPLNNDEPVALPYEAGPLAWLSALGVALWRLAPNPLAVLPLYAENLDPARASRAPVAVAPSDSTLVVVVIRANFA